MFPPSYLSKCPIFKRQLEAYVSTNLLFLSRNDRHFTLNASRTSSKIFIEMDTLHSPPAMKGTWMAILKLPFILLFVRLILWFVIWNLVWIYPTLNWNPGRKCAFFFFLEKGVWYYETGHDVLINAICNIGQCTRYFVYVPQRIVESDSLCIYLVISI